MARTAALERKTSESDVFVEVNLDGTGVTNIETTVPFYNHMLTALGKHALFDLTIKASGDTDIDAHHVVEDVAIVLGKAVNQALGDRSGIVRFADATVPLDEALAQAVVDISGRPYFAHSGEPDGYEFHRIGGNFTGSLVDHVFQSFATNAGICLHLKLISGRDPHHIAEAQFKAVARALRGAVAKDSRVTGIRFHERGFVMTIAPGFPEPDDSYPDDSHSDNEKAFPDEDLAGLDFELPADFVVPDDISELDTLPPATHHEDPDGSEWDDPDWLAKSNSVADLKTPIDPALADFVPAEPPKPVTDLADTDTDIDAELAEMTGEVCELAVLLTPVADAKALAAACALVGVDAIAVPSLNGAVAVLKNTAGDAPDLAAQALSGLLPSFPVLLITKASGQLTAVRYVGGQPPTEVPAGLVVAGASGVVEDLIIGQKLPADIEGSVSSAGVSRTKAMMWLSKIAKHRKQR